MSFLAPLFFLGLAAIAAPVIVHLIQRERKDVIEFPSLMFLQRIPYQSVERRRIHNWWLFVLRVAAMALIVLAFSRPFFAQDPVKAAAAITGAREVVILLDRSASMGYGQHWSRAQDEARKIVSGLSGGDKATLVLFDSGPEEAVRATSDRSQLEAGIRAAAVGAGATRYAPALRLAQSMLSRSTLPRKEAYLITDFQKSGWQRQEDIHLPEGATITPIPVGELETSNLAVSSVSIKRASFSNEERVTLTAGLTNRSATPVAKVPVRLEIDGRLIATKDLTVGPNASGAVTFDPVTVAEANLRGVIRAGTDKMPADNVFQFVLSPSRPVSVLVIQAEGAPARSSLFFTTALSVGSTPPFAFDVVTPARVTPASFDRRAVVVLNDTTALSSATDAQLKRFVDQGGGLLIGLGDHTPFGTDTGLLPGSLGSAIDRTAVRGGTLGHLDYSHPIFEPFKDPRNGNFSVARYAKYRTLTPADTDRVLARFDDGAVAMVERRVGSGRVIAWTSTLDDSWNDSPLKAMYLPVVHRIVRYLAQYEEPEAWYTVGRMLDIAAPISQIVREGQVGTSSAQARSATGIVVSPSGTQATLGLGGASSIALSEQGFYSVRLQGMGSRRPYEVAVNLDPSESELSAMSPTEFVASATGRAAVTVGGQSLEHPEETVEDIEKKQANWWYLLLAGVAALVAEAVLANQLSKRAGTGLSHSPNPSLP